MILYICVLEIVDWAELDKKALNQLKNYIERLNGTIIIVQGNHCTDKRLIYRQCKNVQQVDIATTFKYRGYHFFILAIIQLSLETLKNHLNR